MEDGMRCGVRGILLIKTPHSVLPLTPSNMARLSSPMGHLVREDSIFIKAVSSSFLHKLIINITANVLSVGVLLLAYGNYQLFHYVVTPLMMAFLCSVALVCFYRDVAIILVE
jgi:hypothetical protein